MSTEYIGKMLDGQMHGHGKLIYENEEYYEGDFVRGKWGESKRLYEVHTWVSSTFVKCIWNQENAMDRACTSTLTGQHSKVS